jgi:hypothetical protein
MLQQLVQKGGVAREMEIHKQGRETVLGLRSFEVAGESKEIHKVFLNREVALRQTLQYVKITNYPLLL